MFAYNFGEALGEFAIIAWIFVIFGFILEFVLGFVCMNIMKKKGYNMPAAWFCCGLFLGVIGLVICLVMEDKTKQMPPYNNGQYPNQQYGQPYQNGQFNPQFNQQFAQQPQGVRCQSCGMMNPPDAKTCIQCGKRLF